MTDSKPNYDMDKPGDDLQACRERVKERERITQKTINFEPLCRIEVLNIGGWSQSSLFWGIYKYSYAEEILRKCKHAINSYRRVPIE